MSFEAGCGNQGVCGAVECLDVQDRRCVEGAAKKVIQENGNEQLTDLFVTDERAVVKLASDALYTTTDEKADAAFVIIRKLVTGVCPCQPIEN